jgi:cysteinyl-tRNA synthetase
MKRDRLAAPPKELLPGTPEERALISSLLDARRAAREARDFARADAIRAALDAAGVEVQDRGTDFDFGLKPGYDLTGLDALS